VTDLLVKSRHVVDIPTSSATIQSSTKRIRTDQSQSDIGLVICFPFDYMHLICLGVMSE